MSSTEPRRRADAERSIAAILDATGRLLRRGTLPPMNEIARAAGVGRVTLYAHFPSREELVGSVVERAIEETTDLLAGLDLEHDAPERALARLVRTAWPLLDRSRRLRTVVLAELGQEWLRRKHDPAMRHLEQLVERGQNDGSFRADLPGAWLVSTFYAILHAAADEVDAGRVESAEAPDLLVPTLLAVLVGPS